MYSKYFKRILDLIVCLFAIIFLSPIFVIIALMIKIDSSGPIIFVQRRLGRNAKQFNLFKFRTMTDKKRSSNLEIFGRNAELTRLGYWLRRFKIDEFPQLINIILNDMSIVGPRPPLPEQLNKYTLKTMERLKVRPGLTGLAQINGNIYISWSDRWKLDLKYVKEISFFLDILIMFKTLAVVFFGEKKYFKKL